MILMGWAGRLASFPFMFSGSLPNLRPSADLQGVPGAERLGERGPRNPARPQFPRIDLSSAAVRLRLVVQRGLHTWMLFTCFHTHAQDEAGRGDTLWSGCVCSALCIPVALNPSPSRLANRGLNGALQRLSIGPGNWTEK